MGFVVLLAVSTTNLRVGNARGRETDKRKKRRRKPQMEKTTTILGEGNFYQDIDISLILKEGSFIAGGRGTGKSTLGKWIAEKLLSCGVQVKVFDSSLTWVKNSSMPYTYRVKRFGNYLNYLPDISNVVFDLSRLTVSEIREFVNGVCAVDFQQQVELTDLGIEKPLVFIFEEVQNEVPTRSLKSNDYSELSRLICQGRNFQIGYVAICQKLQMVDSDLIEISGLRWWFKNEGDNTLRKIRNWLPKEYLWRIRDLKTGEAFKQFGTNVKLIKTKRFPTAIRPQRITFEKPKPIGVLEAIKRVFGGQKIEDRMPYLWSRRNTR